jgi:hypothetical protein
MWQKNRVAIPTPSDNSEQNLSLPAEVEGDTAGCLCVLSEEQRKPSGANQHYFIWLGIDLLNQRGKPALPIRMFGRH